MKIIHIITGLNDGGAEGALFRLATFTRLDATQLVVSLTNDGKYGNLLRDRHIEVHSLNMPRSRVTINGLIKLYKLIRKHKPDIVQTWMYHSDLLGGLVARLAGCKNIIWGIRHTDHDPIKTSLSTRVITRLCAFFSYFIPRKIVSCAQRGLFVHSSLGYRSDNFIVIPNGYDLSYFRKDDAAKYSLRSKFGYSVEIPLIGMVGRWDPQKDHLNLLHAIAKIKNNNPLMKCILVGTDCDDDNPMLSKYINNLGLNSIVKAVGRRNDIPNIMNAIDILVLPSSYGEAFPNVVAEAMACETPCIVTDVGDSSYIVAETGWVVKPKDPDGLAMAIDTALKEFESNSMWSMRCIKARRRIVDEFSLSNIANQYLLLWNEILNK